MASIKYYGYEDQAHDNLKLALSDLGWILKKNFVITVIFMI